VRVQKPLLPGEPFRFKAGRKGKTRYILCFDVSEDWVMITVKSERMDPKHTYVALDLDEADVHLYGMLKKVRYYPGPQTRKFIAGELAKNWDQHRHLYLRSIVSRLTDLGFSDKKVSTAMREETCRRVLEE
jgi:hypothetical protein